MEMLFAGRQAMSLAALALALAALAGSASYARAGVYHVYGCRTPAGQPAPADGWSGSVAPGGAFDQYARNTCAEGGALIAALGDQTVHAAYIDKATWTFSAPAGTNVAGATIYRAGDNAGAHAANFTYEFWLDGATESSFIDQCLYTLGCSSRGNFAQPLSSENHVSVPAADLGSHLSANAACTGFLGAECAAGTGDANGYAAAAYVYASDIALEQNQGPTVSDVGGELASAPSLSGTSDLTFSASDPVSGVYQAVVTVDGQAVESPVLDENGGRCRQVGLAADGRPAYLYVQPCVGSLSADISLDTSDLTDGPHHLVVMVTDAAGNAAPVLDRDITVSNPPAGCQAGAAANASTPAATLFASWKGTRSSRLTSRFGRARTLVGRLEGPGAAPIAGATVDVLSVPRYEGATPQASTVQTTADGAFAMRLPGGVSSRTLCLSYRPAGGGAPATRTLVLNVHAGIALSVSPDVSGVGRSIIFHGRLLGGPVPHAGKQLVLEARSPGGPWLQFRLIRTGPRGRFSASYRFRFPGPAAYQFRALSEVESDYPFAAGASNVVGVREH